MACKVRGKGSYQSISAASRIQCAYDKETQVRSLARLYDLHHKSVPRNQIVVSKTYQDGRHYHYKYDTMVTTTFATYLYYDYDCDEHDHY